MNKNTYNKILNYSQTPAQKLYREGMDLYFGITQPVSKSEALGKLYKSATLGYVPAILRFNEYCGVGQRMKADELLKKGADVGDPICAYFYAQICYKSKKKSEEYILQLFYLAHKCGINVTDKMRSLINILPQDKKDKWITILTGG